MKLRQLLESVSNEQEIRIAAWLYMLEYPYKGEMKISSWKNDNRMGIAFLEAMEILNKKGLIDINDDQVKSKPSAKNYIYKVFGKANDEEAADELGEKFVKYNTSRFTLSSIPFDIFEVDYERSTSKEDYKWKPEYSILQKWIKSYQRYPDQPYNTKLNVLRGDENLVDQNKTYRLFRGIYIRQMNVTNELENLKVGDLLKTNRLSWTTSKSIALKFSKGSTNHSDSEKWKPGDISILIEHTFGHEDILCDLYYMDIRGFNYIDFPSEKEVIVFPRSRKYKIIEILK